MHLNFNESWRVITSAIKYHAALQTSMENLSWFTSHHNMESMEQMSTVSGVFRRLQERRSH